MMSSLYEVLNALVKDETDIRYIGKEKDTVLDKIDDNLKNVFNLIMDVCSMHPSGTKGTDVFVPFLILDGKRSFAMEDLSNNDIDTLKNLDLDKFPLVIRARLEDVFWCFKTENYHFFGQQAVIDYINLFNVSFNANHWVQCVAAIERGTDIAARLGKNSEVYLECIQQVCDKLKSLDGKDTSYCSIKLISLLVDQDYFNTNFILEMLGKTIANTTNIRKLETAYQLKIQVLRANKESVEECQLELANHYIEYTDEIKSLDNVYMTETYLIKAIKIYEQLKKHEKKKKAVFKLYEIQKKKIDNLHYFDFEFDCIDISHYLKKKFDGLSIEESIIELAALIEFFTLDDLEKTVLEKSAENVFSSMAIEEIVDADGHIITKIPPLDIHNPTSLKLHMLREANQREDIEGYFFKDGVNLVRDKFGLDDNCLDFLFEDNWIIPEGRENIIKAGLLYGLNGEMYNALHILAPQAEHIFRTIAKQVGAITDIIDDKGLFKEKALYSVFNLPELRDCYNNDRLFLFQGLLNEPAGANIRNRIAHGIMTEEEANQGVPYYFIGALLKLIILASPNALTILIAKKEG